jgi:long-chain acyl-CoA synthetase
MSPHLDTPWSLRESLAGRNVLLTGVTGFLGKVFAVMLLDRFPEIGRLTLLVRGRKNGALDRLARIADTSPCFRPLREKHGADLGRFLSERLHVLDADLGRPGFGLAPDVLEQLEQRIDVVVHCAGLTDFDPDPKKAFAVNTRGAMAIADLAERARVPLIHISTCYVAGVNDGPVPESLEAGVSPNGTRFDPEATLDAVERYIHKPKLSDRVDRGREAMAKLGWPNIYTGSKGLAEHILAERPGLDLTIVRPSIVECAASYPFAGWNEGINTAGPLAWLISTAFRRLPAKPEHHFDIVPVDYVARGMLLALGRALSGVKRPSQKASTRVLQLASGDIHPLTFDRTIELTGLGLRRYVRKGGGTAMERRWFRHLDPVPGTPGDRSAGWFVNARIRRFLPRLQEGIASLLDEDDLPESATTRLSDAHKALQRWARDLDQIDTLLELYHPFIAGYDWVFETAGARDLAAGLPADERDLAYDVTELDWRQYWVDVEFPGLMTWCIPILRGESVPDDRPSTPPLQLVSPADLDRVASK